MQIEVGKYYKTRDGKKVWINGDTRMKNYPFSADNGHSYTPEGSVWDNGMTCKSDLIAEWHEGPVRTVTRKEIVPGTYGNVEISHHNEIAVSWLEIKPERLRKVIATLTQIADALEARDA